MHQHLHQHASVCNKPAGTVTLDFAMLELIGSAHQVESLLTMPWLELRVSLPSLRASHSQNRTPCSGPSAATDWFSVYSRGSTWLSDTV